MPLFVRLQEREDFEARTLRALLGAAATLPVMFLCRKLHLPVSVPFFAMLGAGIGAFSGSWKMRLALGLGLLVSLVEGMSLRLPRDIALLGMGLGTALLADLGGLRRRPLRSAAGMLGSGGLVLLGMYVKTVMDARLFHSRPGMVGLGLGVMVVALFWSVGRLAAHVTVHGSRVGSRGEALAARLQGEVQGLVSRAVLLHAECRREVDALPSGPGRTQLQGVLDTLATGVFTLAEEYAELEARLRGARAEEVGTQVKELRAKAAAMTDAVARRQLELAASSLGEELNHLDVLDRKRERLLAQLHAQVALVERARVSLVGVRGGGDLAAKGAQAAQLAQRLSEMGQEDAASVPPPPERLSGRA